MIADIKPAIGLCARANYPGFAALHYRELMGFSVIPCAGKKPALNEWKFYQRHAATPDRIRQWSRGGFFGNVGIICGAVSGNLVVMDLDGDTAVEAFGLVFPHLLNTYTVTSGSGHGQHLYYFVDDLPPTTRVTGCDYGNIELRANGCYVVAPPSIHPDSGKPYRVERPVEIARLTNMRNVVEWIKDLMRSKHGGNLPPAANAGQVYRATAWARTALEQEAGAVRRAAHGGANNQLNRSAFKLGQIVANGQLDRLAVEAALFDAASAGGLVGRDGEQQTRRTIKSGLDAGIRNPRKYA